MVIIRVITGRKTPIGLGAGVLDDVEAVGGDAAVAGAADGDVLDLGAAVGQRRHRRLRSSVHRTGRSTRRAEVAEEQVLGVGHGLGAEAATDVGDHHAHPLEGQAVVVGVHALGGVGALAGELLHEPVVLPPRRRDAGLDRAGRDRWLTMRWRTTTSASIGSVEAGSEPMATLVPWSGCTSTAVGEGVVEGDDGLERVVVDDDGLGGVDGLGEGLGHDGHDRLADEAHHVGGEDRAGEGRRHRHHAGRRDVWRGRRR